jgi:3-oxoacyl-[acyl-carrier protein] reductase
VDRTRLEPDGWVRVEARTALVTGGSRGIGAAIAKRLAADGFNLTLAARTPELLCRTAKDLRADHGVEVREIVANLLVDDDVRKLVPAHRERFDRLDVLVLNAGIGTVEPLIEASASAYHRTFEINLRAAILLIQDALQLLRSTAAYAPHFGAKIIALSSITGVTGESGPGLYAASKAALISLCETVSIEESQHGVSATAISPGYVKTDMTAWKHQQFEDGSMLRPADVADVAIAITRLPAGTIVPNIVMSRKGERISRA